MSKHTFILQVNKGLVMELDEPEMLMKRLTNLLEGMYPGCDPSIQHVVGRLDPNKSQKVKQ